MRYLEDNLQEQCVTWFRLQYRDKIIFANANGGKRNLKEAFRMKKQGVLAGVSDLTIPEPTSTHHGAFIELKRGANKNLKTSKGVLSKEQKAFLEAMKARGYFTAVCYSLEEFQKVVKDYFPENRKFNIPKDIKEFLEAMPL